MDQEPFRADHMTQSQRRRQAWMIGLGGAVGTLAIGALITLLVVWNWAFHDLPEAPDQVADLWESRLETSLTLLDKDDNILAVRGPLYARTVHLDELPPHVPQAFLAIEDQRYFEHSGVDFRGVARALWVNFRAGETVQGGSTITMQLVKNFILTPDRQLRRKLQEMRLAREIEARFSKTEILELYLNRIYLGARAFGIEAAANRYFSKSAAELTLAEAALLAALPKAPSRLDPTVNLPAAQARAAQVLAAMHSAGFITRLEWAEALAEPARPVTPVASAERTEEIWGHVFDYALAEADLLVPGETPDLVIATTINGEAMRAAYDTLNTVLDAQGEASNAGEAAVVLLDMDGAIRAMAGGRDYADSQFNRAVQAQRQPGSAFKAIVFAAALNAGYDPSDAMWDEPIDLEGWSPENFGGSYSGLVTLAEALKRSINTVAAQIASEVGIDQIVATAHRMGIRSELPELPAIALGAAEVNLLELTAAYSVFAADGVRHDPWLIRSIHNSRGDQLYQHRLPTQDRAALPLATARSMSTMLQDVVIGGTGQRASLGDRPAAGKTGTSQQFRDAWFIGYTADYTAGVWVGNDNDTPMRSVTGGGLPAQIWQQFMTAVHADLPVRDLAAPPPRTRTAREERLAAFYAELSASFSEVIND
ncbi:transglycosylase domain-containing protein [Maricaulis sp. CAU 1757]